MADQATLTGEEKIARRSRRYRNIVIASGLFGGIIGFSLGFFDLGNGNLLTGQTEALRLPPAIAVLIAFGFLIGFVIWPLYSLSKIDEHQQRNNMISMSAGWFAMIGAYPIWQSLAAGGFAEQPTAFGVFLVGLAFTIITIIMTRLRNR